MGFPFTTVTGDRVINSAEPGGGVNAPSVEFSTDAWQQKEYGLQGSEDFGPPPFLNHQNKEIYSHLAAQTLYPADGRGG